MIIALLAFVFFVNCKVYTPTKGLSRMMAFDEYNRFWNKTHASAAEKNARFQNFKVNAVKIAEMNKMGGARFGFTQFSDMSAREFKTKMTGFKPAQLILPFEMRFKREESQPGQNIDWVAAGKTTPVKNQQQCGSCWAFSATETIESAMLMAGQTPQGGAPQELVDCDTNDSGCNGGDPAEAMQWLISQGGQDAESCYPYTAQDGTCAAAQCSPVNKISSTQSISQSESAIYQALQTMGPLSICCDASQWSNYQGGVLTAAQCGDNVDHAIQLTGYNTGQGGYWVVRNSWGTSWGENGFIYLQYGQNTCDITSEVTGASA